MDNVEDVNSSTNDCEFKIVNRPAADAMLIIRGEVVDFCNNGKKD